MAQNESTKLGIVCFANYSGLGNQTKRLAELLRPYKIMVINSQSFSKNREQHFEWYDNFSGYIVNGFPKNSEIKVFLRGLTDVIVCENPLNFSLFSQARAQGIRTYCQSNYEFCDNLNNPHLPLPDVFLMPSYWMLEEMQKRFNNEVIHLPPPMDPSEFTSAREVNLNRRPERLRLLHVVGTLAANDRNGTLDLLKALEHTRGEFSLTIKSQHDLPDEYYVNDSRVIYSISNEQDPAKLYEDFDALILPRRYGGLTLTCNEALMSALPVIMPDISPNNRLLPKEWLCIAYLRERLQTRDLIDVYGTASIDLANKIDWLLKQDIQAMKAQALEIALENFSVSKLKPKYEALWSQR